MKTAALKEKAIDMLEHLSGDRLKEAVDYLKYLKGDYDAFDVNKKVKEALVEVKAIKEGKVKSKTLKEFLREI